MSILVIEAIGADQLQIKLDNAYVGHSCYIMAFTSVQEDEIDDVTHTVLLSRTPVGPSTTVKEFKK